VGSLFSETSNISETGQDRTKVLLMTNRKSHSRFQLVSKSTTLDDLERPLYALCFKTRASFGSHNENLNEDGVNYQRRRCSPMTLDSDNIRFMSIFAGVSLERGVSGVIENVDFRVFGRYVFGTLGK